MSGGDSVPVKALQVYVQENGIIRLESNGLYIGRLDGVSYEHLEAQDEAPTPVFAEGDRVRTPTKGSGTIIVVMSKGTSIGVEHDEPIEGGHACSLRGAAEGRPCKKDHGRWYAAEELQLLGGEVDEQASE